MAFDDVSAERDDGIHLRARKIRVAVLVTRVLNFDADRMRIDIALAAPVRNTGMPGAHRFRHHLCNRAVVGDDVVARDAAFWPRQPIDCFLR